MATTTTVTSNFTGVLAGEVFVQAYKQAPTLANITVLPNIIGAGAMPQLSFAGEIAAYACGHSPLGEVSYIEKDLTTKKLKIDFELCKDKFYQTYMASQNQLGAGANNEIPASIEAAILDAALKSQAEKIDSMIWNGTGGANAIDGFFKLFTADTAVVDVVWTGATITKANVIDALEAVYNVIIDEVLGDSNLKLYVSRNIAKAYKQSLTAQGTNTTNGDKELTYIDLDMIVMPSWPADRMVAARNTNLAFGTNLLADHQSVRLSDDETRLDGKVIGQMVFDAGVNYSFGSEIVYFRK